MNPRTVYFIGLACLVGAVVIAYRNMQLGEGLGARAVPLTLMFVGIILIIIARLRRR